MAARRCASVPLPVLTLTRSVGSDARASEWFSETTALAAAMLRRANIVFMAWSRL